MLERSTPLERAIVHSLRDGGAMTAEEVFRRLDVVRPDFVDKAVVAAVAAAVANGIDRLVAEGLLVRCRGDRVAVSKTGMCAELANSV